MATKSQKCLASLHPSARERLGCMVAAASAAELSPLLSSLWDEEPVT